MPSLQFKRGGFKIMETFNKINIEILKEQFPKNDITEILRALAMNKGDVIGASITLRTFNKTFKGV